MSAQPTPAERPITFDAESVRAILDGRKTQTRRVIKPQPPEDVERGDFDGPYWFTPGVERHGELEPAARDVFGISCIDGDWGRVCPYGAPGDRLWVREAWGDVTLAFQPHECEEPQTWAFRADEAVYTLGANSRPVFLEHMDDSGIVCHRWKSSLFLRKWMARLWLEVTAVRVERLQAIACWDIRAEGVECPTHDFPGGFCSSECSHLRAAFSAGWDELNAKPSGCSWADNPWVWVLEFRRVEESR